MFLRPWRAAATAGVLLGVVGAASAAIIAPGKTAPAWSGKTTAGKSVSSSQLKGKVVLMNFFTYG